MSLDNYVSLDLCARISVELAQQMSPCFGPCGMDKLISTDEKLTSSSCGEDIIKSLKLSHPIGRLMIKSVLDHYSKTGSNVKAFVILLSSILRRFVEMQRKHGGRESTIRILLLRSLRKFCMQVLQNCVVPAIVRDCHHCHFVDNETLRLAIRSFLSQRTSTVDVIADILFRALCCNLTDINYETLKLRLNILISEFDNVCIASSHEPPEKSRIERVLIIPQDYLTYHPLPNKGSNTKQDLGFVLLKTDKEQSGDCVKVDEHQQALSLLCFKSDQMRKFCKLLSSKGVKLLLSDSKIDYELKSCCLFEKISTIQCLPVDDVDKLSRYFGIHPLTSIHEIATDESLQNIGSLKQFGSKIINGQNYAYLEPSSAFKTKWENAEFYDIFPFQIMVCGFSSSSCQLNIRRMKNALKQLNSWLVPCNKTSTRHGKESTSSKGRITGQDALHFHENYKDGPCSSVTDRLSILCVERILTSCASDHSLFSQNPFLSCCGIHLPANGAFETATYIHINKFINNPKGLQNQDSLDEGISEFDDQVCKMISDALIEIPFVLIQNSYAPKCHKLRNMVNLFNELNNFTEKSPTMEFRTSGEIDCIDALQELRAFAVINCRSGKLETSTRESPIESLRSKIELFYDVLHLCQQLLKLEVILPVHKSYE